VTAGPGRPGRLPGERDGEHGAGEGPARLDDDYTRDEDEQVRYLNDLLAIFDAAGVDSAFWFTFAGYKFPRSDDPRADLDLASYGVVAISDDLGTTWQPKKAYHALAAAYSAYSTAEPGA
jgi:hypothetical protein